MTRLTRRQKKNERDEPLQQLVDTPRKKAKMTQSSPSSESNPSATRTS